MADILSSLRSLMAAHSPPLDALIVPSEDYHQSEYVSGRDKRRQFVSGFTGSAGLALITKDQAKLWTDGRYYLQAEKQLSHEWSLMRMIEDPTVDVWMADNLQEKACIGVDPWCISADTAHRWERAFAKKQQKLVQTSTDLVDEVWKGRPADEANPVTVQPQEFTGRSVEEKLSYLREKLKASRARGIIITTLDEVAWLYNIRGSDVPYCPVVHAFAIVTLNSAFLYVDKKKVSSEVNSYMIDNAIEVRDYTAVSSDVLLLASDKLDSSSTIKGKPDTVGNGTDIAEGHEIDLVWVDSASCSFALYSKLNSEKVFQQQSPLALAKALKNPVELDGLRNAHIRDGAAVVQYLVWLDKQMQDMYGASGYFAEGETDKKKKDLRTTKLTEVTVSDKLESFRASKESSRGIL
ncbi:Aminopeptidase P1 [Linum grandiflorum]